MSYRMEVGTVVVECDDPVEALALARPLRDGPKPPLPIDQGATSEEPQQAESCQLPDTTA